MVLTGSVVRPNTLVAKNRLISIDSKGVGFFFNATRPAKGFWAVGHSF